VLLVEVSAMFTVAVVVSETVAVDAAGDIKADGVA